MTKRAIVALLLTATGCTAERDAGGFRLTRMLPESVPLAGGDVRVYFAGADAPAYGYVAINGVSFVAQPVEGERFVVVHAPPLASPTTAAVPIHLAADFLYPAETPSGFRHLTDELSGAGEYRATPAAPSLTPSSGYWWNNLDVPLHPELDALCARTRRYDLSNSGETPLEVSSISVVGDPGFGMEVCAGCLLDVCFSSTAPGAHNGTLSVVTNGGEVSRTFSAYVRPATAGLDATFDGDGGAAFDVGIIEAADSALAGGGVAIATHRTYPGGGFLGQLATVSQTGAVELVPIGSAGPGPHPFNVRGAASGTAFYAIVQASNGYTALARYDGGAREFLVDISMSPYGTSSFPTNGRTVLDVAPSGRVFVTGYYDAVAAYTTAGTLDLSWGDAGAAPVGGVQSSVVDSLGRLVLRRNTDIIRLTPGGAIDLSFSFSGTVTALAAAPGALYAAAGSSLLVLDETGASVPLPLSPSAGTIVDVDVDSAGRLVVTGAGGQVYRYASNGAFLGEVGLGDGARGVHCPASGGCFIVGRTEAETYVVRLAD